MCAARKSGGGCLRQMCRESPQHLYSRHPRHLGRLLTHTRAPTRHDMMRLSVCSCPFPKHCTHTAPPQVARDGRVSAVTICASSAVMINCSQLMSACAAESGAYACSCCGCCCCCLKVRHGSAPAAYLYCTTVKTGQDRQQNKQDRCQHKVRLFQAQPRTERSITRHNHGCQAL